MRTKWLRRLAALVLILALVLLSWGMYIPAKAQLAQWLMRAAWKHSVQTQVIAKPWPWADAWPVARLRVPRLGIDQIVLNADNGAALAFAPGLNPAGVYPGKAGNSLISGHRDTHFRFLRHLAPGDRVYIENRRGEQTGFVVKASRVVDARHARLQTRAEGAYLSLITCYPFEAINPNGPLRYVVIAERVTAPSA